MRYRTNKRQTQKQDQISIKLSRFPKRQTDLLCDIFQIMIYDISKKSHTLYYLPNLEIKDYIHCW